MYNIEGASSDVREAVALLYSRLGVSLEKLAEGYLGNYVIKSTATYVLEFLDFDYSRMGDGDSNFYFDIASNYLQFDPINLDEIGDGRCKFYIANSDPRKFCDAETTELYLCVPSNEEQNGKTFHECVLPAKEALRLCGTTNQNYAYRISPGVDGEPDEYSIINLDMLAALLGQYGITVFFTKADDNFIQVKVIIPKGKNGILFPSRTLRAHQ